LIIDHLHAPIPADLPRHIFVVHEALDIERDLSGISRHLLLKPFTFVEEPQPGAWVLLRIEFVLLEKVLVEVLPNELVEEEATNGEIMRRSQHLKLGVYPSLCTRWGAIYFDYSPKRVDH